MFMNLNAHVHDLCYSFIYMYVGFSNTTVLRGAVCSKTQDSPLYIKRCSIYYIDSLFIISTADLLYRQSIYYIDSRFIISTVDILYRQSIYYIDSRFIISTADILYRQPIYYIDSRYIISTVDSTTPSCFSTCSCACACVYYYSGNAAKLCIVLRWFLGFSLVACPFN